MLKKRNLPICDSVITIKILSSKWRILIIRELWEEPKRTSELKKSLVGISQKVLIASLKSMIEDGIVERKDYNKNRLHVEYKLTPLGDSLKPVILTMEQWGNFYKKQL